MTTKLDLKKQDGVLLLEALIAILLFSIGILAVVGLQANAIKNISQSKFRSDAALLADQLIGQMWANRNNILSYQFAGSGSVPAVLLPWVAQTDALPQGSTYRPQVVVVQTAMTAPAPYTSNQITVTVRWQTPEDLAAGRPPHSHTSAATIPCC